MSIHRFVKTISCHVKYIYLEWTFVCISYISHVSLIKHIWKPAALELTQGMAEQEDESIVDHAGGHPTELFVDK